MKPVEKLSGGKPLQGNPPVGKTGHREIGIWGKRLGRELLNVQL